jgi:hypothetical protein
VQVLYLVIVTSAGEVTMSFNKKHLTSQGISPARQRLTEKSLVLALSRIDPSGEPTWFAVACVLANVWGEEGRNFFIRFSEGGYWSSPYQKFNEKEVHTKYDRVLRRKSGGGNSNIRKLLKMADLKINDVEFEQVNRAVNDEEAQKTRAGGILQLNYSLISLGGQVRVINNQEVALLRANETSHGINLYQRKDAILIMQRLLVAEGLPMNPLFINNFFVDPKTTVYEALAFHPIEQPKNVLNFWREPVAPIAGEGTKEILYFLRDIICAGDNKATEYLLNFLAHMLQRPEIKPGIIVVLLGGQGIGKGTFFRLLQAIWRSSVMLVQDIDQVVGRFNSGLERCFVVCMDEAIFRGDRKASERLKALVTEPFFRIEEKYQPSRTIESFHRFFAATNSKHFGQVDIDDRRYFFLKVSNQRQCDHNYFAQIHKLIADRGVMSAFVHDLYERDIELVNIYERPQAEEHVLQRIKSLHGFPRFWFDFLVSEQVKNEGCFIATLALKQLYTDYNQREEKYFPLQSNEISNYISEMCPSALKARRAEGDAYSERGYNFPPLSVCREEFEVYFGAKLDWDIYPGNQPMHNSPF